MKDIQTVVGLVAFHETPAVYVDDLAGPSIVAPKHVEATYGLPKTLADARGPFLFLFAQMGNESTGGQRKEVLVR